jgi:hypothetical protein
MNSIFPLLGFAVVVAILAFRKANSQNTEDNEAWPYYPKKHLSLSEQVLYYRLIEALPEHKIHAQVQLTWLLGAKKTNNFSNWMNCINRMTADFVVCNQDSSVVAVVELDDASKQKADRQKAKIEKDKALDEAKIKVIRWHTKAMPNVPVIQAAFSVNSPSQPEILSELLTAQT